MVLYRSAGVWLEFVYVQTNFHSVLISGSTHRVSIIVMRSGFKLKVSLEANKSKRYACQAIIGDCEFIALYCDLCAVLLQVAENFKLKGMC